MSREDMAVGKDPAIKLFGRTIFVQDIQTSDDAESLDTGSTQVKTLDTEQCKPEHFQTANDLASFTCSRQHEISQDSTTSNSHVEVETKPHLKRPDKILPCPRCNSPDTKFCYFNNYNVNQPRHFCKSCQRYWTAGGTVRNVPIGAGRRRNKQLASQYRQIIASSDMGPTAFTETHDMTAADRQQVLEESSSSCTTSGLSVSLVGQDPSSPNETVLKFGSDSPHCNSNGCQERASLPCGSPLNATLQFVPAASYWNCIPVWVASSQTFFRNNENAVRVVLGKHSRDQNAANEEIVEKGFCAPKTLRINNVDR